MATGAEVRGGEIGQQVVVRQHPARGDLSVRQEGHPSDEDVVGETAPVGIDGGPAAVVGQDVRQDGGGRRVRLGGRIAVPLQDLRPRPQVFRHVVRRMPGVVRVLRVVGIDERVDRRLPAAVHLHEFAVTAHADGRPQVDQGIRAQHVVGHLQRDALHVLVAEGVVPRPREAVQGAFGVGEERIAAYAGEEAAATRLDGLRRRVEADRYGTGEHLTGRFRAPGVGAGGVVGRARLPAVVRLREHEREGGVGLVVTVVVDVDAVHRVGVQFRAHQERRGRAQARRERVHVDDQHRSAGVSGRREGEQVGQVQARVVAGKLEIGRAEVVGHGRFPRSATRRSRRAEFVALALRLAGRWVTSSRVPRHGEPSRPWNSLVRGGTIDRRRGRATPWPAVGQGGPRARATARPIDRSWSR